MISIKLLRNIIEIILRYGCSPVNLLHIFRTPLDDCFCKSLLRKSFINNNSTISKSITLLSLIVAMKEKTLSSFNYYKKTSWKPPLPHFRKSWSPKQSFAIPAQTFSCEYWKIFKYKSFMEHFWWLLLAIKKQEWQKWIMKLW